MNKEINQSPSFLRRKTEKGEAQIAYLAPAFKGAVDINRATVLFCGGFNSNMRGSKGAFLSQYCQKKGLNFCRFDYQGHGESSGDFAEGTIGDWFDDALAILEQNSKAPVVIVGSSMGGWMALLLAKQCPDLVKGLVLIAPAPDFPDKLMWSAMDASVRSEIETKGVWYRPSEFEGEESYPITLNLIEESRRHNLLDGDGINFDGPVHILHGSSDEVVPMEHAFKVADALSSEDVTVEIIKNGDHRLSTDIELERLGDRLEKLLKKI